jgi:hypothetical protein
VEDRVLQRKPYESASAIRIIGVTRYNKPKELNLQRFESIPVDDVVYCRFWHSEQETSNMARWFFKQEISILFIYKTNYREDDVVQGTVQYMPENWRLNYSACFIYCPLDGKTKLPTSVSVYGKDEVRTAYSENGIITLKRPGNRVLIHGSKRKRDAQQPLAVCVKPMHYNFDRVS